MILIVNIMHTGWQMKILDTIIVINSSRRANSVVTPEFFPEDVIHWVVAVPYEQYPEYEDSMPTDHVQAIPENIPQCLSDQRQWVMEYYTKQGYKYIWLMDDDLVFLHRTEGVKLRKSEQKDVKRMFNSMRKHVEEVPMVGIGARFGNNVIKDVKDVTRIHQCYIIDTDVYKKVGAVFNPISMFLGQDTHMTLSFLNAGYLTREIGEFAFNEASSSPGGCDAYRDGALAKRCAIWLMDNHPEVELKAKITKTKWGLTELKDGRRFKVDYNIKWKKAYKPKKVRKAGGLSRLLGRK